MYPVVYIKSILCENVRKKHGKRKTSNIYRKKKKRHHHQKMLCNITLKLFSDYVAGLISLLHYEIFSYILFIKQRYLLEQKLQHVV